MKNKETKFDLTREMVDSGDYEVESGVIVLLAPEGVSTVRHIRNVASMVLFDNTLPQRSIRLPNDGVYNEYQHGSIFNINTDED